MKLKREQYGPLKSIAIGLVMIGVLYIFISHFALIINIALWSGLAFVILALIFSKKSSSTRPANPFFPKDY